MSYKWKSRKKSIFYMRKLGLSGFYFDNFFNEVYINNYK